MQDNDSTTIDGQKLEVLVRFPCANYYMYDSEIRLKGSLGMRLVTES